MNDRDRSDEIPTLLDKATEDEVAIPAVEFGGDEDVYILTPLSKLQDIAAEVILAKLAKLRVVEELLDAHELCCAHCDANTLNKIGQVIASES